MIVNALTKTAEVSGFGINLDLLETNIINLSVVVGVLIYFGKDILQDTLTQRKNLLIKRLQEIDKIKYQKTCRLEAAVEGINNALLSAEQIHLQGLLNASQVSDSLLGRVEEDIKRLESSKMMKIRLEEEKAIAEVCQRVTQMALNHAMDQLTVRLDRALQRRIMGRSVKVLTNAACK